MSVKEEKLCRLCFDLTGNEFDIIDEITKEMLNDLPLKMNLDISENPIMCRDCSETVKKFYNFISICKGMVEAFIKKETKLEVDAEAGIDEKFRICRFCLNLEAQSDIIYVDVLVNAPLFEKIWPTVFSGMDHNVMKNSLICRLCRDNLDGYFEFVQNCWDIEEKIDVYCQHTTIISDGKVNLSSVKQFSVHDMSECSDQCVIKRETGVPENVLFEPYEGLIKQEDMHIKDEAFSVEENFGQTPQNKYYKTKYLENVNMHVPSHKEASEVKMCKCALCTYQTKFKRSLNCHMLIHKNTSEVEIHKCGLCNYEAKHKHSLNRHVSTHKDTSEVKMCKCSLCEYETRRKGNLKMHMLIHKDISEVEMYKCALCNYETKLKSSLKKHVLTHKDTSEVKMYKCVLCTYETRCKESLKTHMLIHKDVSEVKLYKCTLCSYETKYKSSLKRHMLTHTDTSEVNMFKCTLCSYETKDKGTLKRHVLIHKDTSEVKMYKCTLCSYETKYKGALKRHVLTHKDTSEVKMYKCVLCNYETNHRGNLRWHVLSHRTLSVEIY